MSEVVPYRDPKTPATAPQKPTMRADQIAVTLRRIDEKLIAPRRRIREHFETQRLRSARTIAANADKPFEPLRAKLLTEDCDYLRVRLRNDLVAFPTPDELRPHLAFAEEALAQPVNRAQNRILLGMTVDAFPNTRAHAPETYFEQVVFHVEREGYPPVVVACATQAAVRRKTFLPAVAEVLKLCRDELDALEFDCKVLRTAMRAAEWLAMAAEALDAYEAGERTPAPPEPEVKPWTQKDLLPFGDDDGPSCRAEMARDIRQLVQRLGRRIR